MVIGPREMNNACGKKVKGENREMHEEADQQIDSRKTESLKMQSSRQPEPPPRKFPSLSSVGRQGKRVEEEEEEEEKGHV